MTNAPALEPDPKKPVAQREHRQYDVLIVDGGGAAVTSWATHRNLDTAEYRVKAAFHVFMMSLSSLSRVMSPGCHIIVVWDGRDNRAYRRGMHPHYKHGRGSVINREEVGFVVQQANELLNALGVDTVDRPMHEADDMVATIATELADNGHKVMLYSDDKDYYQLVSPDIHLHRRSFEGVVITPQQAAVMGIEYGERYLHAKAVMGDSGDNIKGLKGIGEKKALQLLEANPDAVAQCLADPSTVDWSNVHGALRKAFIRAGSRLVHPMPLVDKKFASAFAAKRGMNAPTDYDLGESVYLEATAKEIRWSLKLVTMNRELEYESYTTIGKRDDERVYEILHRLGIDRDEDVTSAVNSITMMMTAGRDDDAAPNAAF